MNGRGKGHSAHLYSDGAQIYAVPFCGHGKDPNGRSKRRPEDSGQERWTLFEIGEVRRREFKLDGFKWLKEDSVEDADDLPEPEELATDAVAELEWAVKELNAVLALLENGGKG